MQQTIEQLYHGKIFPSEDIKPQGESYEIALKEIRILHESFRKDLTEPLKAKFDELEGNRLAMDNQEATQAFVEGYKLGMRMTIEALT